MEHEENPYAAPRATDRAVGVKSGRREDLKTVALAQKSIMVCILLQLLGGAARFFVPEGYLLFILIGLLCVLVASTVSVFVLAMKVFNVGLGIVYAIGALIPCLGLIILFIVNQKAIKVLRENGHEVGFLGADLSKF
jgi:hypothetical protein